jgi:hypothetical protein
MGKRVKTDDEAITYGTSGVFFKATKATALSALIINRKRGYEGYEGNTLLRGFFINVSLGERIRLYVEPSRLLPSLP